MPSRTNSFRFRDPMFLCRRFPADVRLWELAQQQVPAQQAVAMLMGEKPIDNDYMAMLLRQRYENLMAAASNQINRAGQLPVPELPAKKTFSRSPQEYELLRDKIEQIKEAKQLMRNVLKLRVPGYGWIPVQDLGQEHFAAWHNQGERLKRNAARYMEDRAPWIELVQRFGVQRVGDIPNWEHEVSSNPRLLSQVTIFEAA